MWQDFRTKVVTPRLFSPGSNFICAGTTQSGLYPKNWAPTPHGIVLHALFYFFGFPSMVTHKHVVWLNGLKVVRDIVTYAHLQVALRVFCLFVCFVFLAFSWSSTTCFLESWPRGKVYHKFWRWQVWDEGVVRAIFPETTGAVSVPGLSPSLIVVTALMPQSPRGILHVYA